MKFTTAKEKILNALIDIGYDHVNQAQISKCKDMDEIADVLHDLGFARENESFQFVCDCIIEYK